MKNCQRIHSAIVNLHFKTIAIVSVFLLLGPPICIAQQGCTSYNANTISIIGNNNVGIGVDVLTSNTGSSNTAIGYRSLFLNTSGSNNTSTGYGALRYNTTGGNNSASGTLALFTNTSGNSNVANGLQSLYLNTTGSANNAIGYQALYSNVNGATNVANGFSAMFANTSGSSNVAVGSQALFTNTTGSFNCAEGYISLFYNTTGTYNLANGHAALYNNVIGSKNTAIGARALLSNYEGNSNVAIGDSAGFKSKGNYNVYLGHKSGANETGSNKFYLANDVSNTLIYGDFSSRQILLGEANPTGYTFKGNRTLNVLGGVLADSVRVALSSNWADYVFDEDYVLAPLEEVSDFIKTNKHLPDIPTSAEVKRDGIDLAEMNAKLLAKIEELTLYMLQQKKQNELQQKEIDELKMMVKKVSITN